MLFACLCANASDFLNLNWGEYTPDVIKKLETEYGKITHIEDESHFYYINNPNINIDGVTFEYVGFNTFQDAEVPRLDSITMIGEKYEDMQALLDDIQKLYDKFHAEYSLVYFEDKFDSDRKERIAFIGNKKDRFSTSMVIGTITDTYNGVVKHQLWMGIIPNIVDLCEYLGIKFKPEYD